MSTVRTTICRHIDIEDIPLYERTEPEAPLTVVAVSTEPAFYEFFERNRVKGNTDENYPSLIRCAETGEVVGVQWDHYGNDTILQDCTRIHWRLVHQTIETGQEVHA